LTVLVLTQGEWSEAMDDLYSEIDAAKKIATRLIKRNRDVATAEKKRDICLYKFLQTIHELSDELPKTKPSELKSRYSSIPKSRDRLVFAMKLTHPNLHPGLLYKYKRILLFFRGTKKPGQSVGSFVHGYGGINRCVEEAKKWIARQKTHLRKRGKHKAGSHP
jgi:hypothetical protein